MLREFDQLYGFGRQAALREHQLAWTQVQVIQPLGSLGLHGGLGHLGLPASRDIAPLVSDLDTWLDIELGLWRPHPRYTEEDISSGR